MWLPRARLVIGPVQAQPKRKAGKPESNPDPNKSKHTLPWVISTWWIGYLTICTVGRIMQTSNGHNFLFDYRLTILKYSTPGLIDNRYARLPFAKATWGSFQGQNMILCKDLLFVVNFHSAYFRGFWVHLSLSFLARSWEIICNLVQGFLYN